MKFHKKFHIVALLAAILVCNARAAEVSSEQVVRAVSAWANANGSAFANPGMVLGAESVVENGTNLYWVVRMSNGGAVIASPDTDLDLVVAVLEKFDGTFPAGHPLTSILRADMKKRLSVIRSASTSSPSASTYNLRMTMTSSLPEAGSELPEDVKASVAKANSQWAKYDSAGAKVKLRSVSLKDGDDSPYVRRIVDGFEDGGRFTHWNQGESPVDRDPLYNLYTPGKSVCGCVATAGAAIMQFFGCTNDIGEVEGEGCSYNGKQYPCKTRPGELDWSVFPVGGVDSVNEFISGNEAARDIIGRTVYNLGVLVGMDWTDGESGANTLQLAEALVKYGFNTAKAVTFDGDLEGTTPYYKMVYAQNWAGAPVILSIGGDLGGHAVVACGYARDGDGEEFCRVFMGWGGIGDSWYKFPEVESFSTIKGAVTMLGYQKKVEVADMPDVTVDIPDDAVVPVCGKANVKNTMFEIPGGTYKVEVDIESGEAKAVPSTLVVPVDENGYFAARIPISTPNPRLVHPDSGSSMAIAPFDSKVLSSGEGRVKLEAAMPGEQLFLVLNMQTAPTVVAGREIASREGKALLMVSGSGDEREGMLIDYISYLDSVHPLSDSFIFVRVNSSDSTSIFKDGNPSIGVFNPDVGSADLRWWYENGRLAYNNFLDYGVDNSDTLNYTFGPEDAANLTNSVNAVLSDGYGAYLRSHSGVSVTVVVKDIDTGDVLPIDSVNPAPGIHENCWTSGVDTVLSAFGTYTNLSKGVVYSCIGWTTNESVDADGYLLYEPGSQAVFNFEKDEKVSLIWLYTPSHYRVEASAIGLPPVGVPAGVVVPENAWVEAGARVTLKAERVLDDYKLKEWFVSRKSEYGIEYGDYENYYGDFNEEGLEANLVQNGNTISFSVFEPVVVNPNYGYEDGIRDPGEADAYSVEILSSPVELADIATLKGGMKWGENTLEDKMAFLAPAKLSYPVTETSNWVCVGWEVNGVTNSCETTIPLSVSSAENRVTCLWELVYDAQENQGGSGEEPDIPVVPDVPDVPDEPVLPVPAPIAFSSITQESDGSWTLVLTNGVKGCWYHLYYATQLSSPVNWQLAAPAEGVNPHQAAEDGAVVFRVSGSGDSMFWSAKATSMEADN